MRFEAFGRPRGEAPAVLLSAGLGGLAAYWGPQRAALAARFHVLAYDHRGTGANREALPDPYAISAMADDVLAVLDEAGVARCALVGHALGGLVGLELALRAPERLSALVLANAWAAVAAPTRRCFEARLALLRHVGLEAYVRAQPIFLYPAAWLARNADRVARDDVHGFAQFQGADTLERRVGALLAFDVADRLGAITTPTLVTATRDDVLVPYTCSEVLAAGIPGARLWLAPEGGHASSVTEPEAFNEAVAGFLGGL